MSISEWPRWIISSVTDHFDEGLTDINLYVNNQKVEEDHQTVIIDIDHDFEKHDSNNYTIEVRLSIVVQIVDDSDIYSIADINGTILTLLKSIPIYRYGLDSSLFGCLQPISKVRINNLGRIQPANQVQRSIIEQEFKMIAKE